MNRFRVSGPPRALELALERIHVWNEVHGVLVEESGFEVYVDGRLPELSGVTISPLPVVTDWPTGREHDEPMYVGDSIMVRPPWVPSPPDFEGVELVVPRAMAFGSGEHASTRAALAVMEKVVTDSVGCLADVGTGSGILARYAQLRGCQVIAACDIDRDSVVAAGELLSDVQVMEGGPDTIRGQFDCVVANMRAAEILDCLAVILELWNRSGPLVLSGLRESEVSDLIAAVDCPVELRIVCEDFTGLAFRAQTSGEAR